MATGKEVVRRGGPGAMGLVAVLLCCLALVACAGSSTASVPPQLTGTTRASSGTATGISSQTGPTPTPYDQGTPGAVLGTTDACAASGPPSAALPSDIPVYADAQMTIGSINGTKGVFGLCSPDSISTIDAFYATNLPAAGWQGVTDDPLAGARQLTAQQAQTSLIVTILPDTRQDGKTNILIIYSGK